MELSKQQIKHLKALAHPRKPVVRIGQHGISENVLKELEIALNHHELIKLKVAGERQERTAIIESVCKSSKAVCVSQTGGIAVLFRRNNESPKITFE